jgi:hypothetical protein
MIRVFIVDQKHQEPTIKTVILDDAIKKIGFFRVKYKK